MVLKACEDLQEGSLAAPARTQEGDELAFANTEVDVRERMDVSRLRGEYLV
jgi:hypothetical protein